jgi:hypothetical protein
VIELRSTAEHLGRALEALRWAQRIVERSYPHGPFISTVVAATSSVVVYGPSAFAHATQLRDGEDGIDLGCRILKTLDRVVAHDGATHTS